MYHDASWFYIGFDAVQALSDRRDATMRLTETLEHFKFQWFIHTARITWKCDQKTEIEKVLIFPLI